jgi:hypothetical protein
MYKIEFTVPSSCGKYTTDLIAKNVWTWILFTDHVSRQMGCSISTLKIGYSLPWQTKASQKTPPKLLTEETYGKMMVDIDVWRSGQIAKKKSAAVIVKLFNLCSEPATTAKVHYFPINFLPVLINSQGKKQSSSGTTPRAISTIGHEAKLAAIMQQINANNHCEKHKSADYVKFDGTHQRFTIMQITQWADLIVRDFGDVGV